jgi:hypothetical protein
MKSARARYILLVENATLRRPARRISHAKLQADPSRLAGGSEPIKWFPVLTFRNARFRSQSGFAVDLAGENSVTE